MILWSMRNPYSLVHLRSQYMSITNRQHPSEFWQSDNVKFTKNSTLLFLSRLVFMLNQRVRRQRHLIDSLGQQSGSASSVHQITNVKQRPPRNALDMYYTTSPTSLIMTKPPNFSLGNPIHHSYSWYLNRMPPAPSIPSYFTANDYNLYHVIDSCGLFSGQGDRGGYLCRPNRANGTKRSGKSSPNTRSPNPPEFDHLIPQCNPTCGFLSNPNRMKLVDVLALYEVNTELLASILGLTTSELKNLDSEQQMQMLFCGNSQLTRRARKSASSRSPFDNFFPSWVPPVTSNRSLDMKSHHLTRR